MSTNIGGYPVSVWIFSVASLGVWLATLVWAWRQGPHRRIFVTLLVLTTLFWAGGETLAIRLGKYEYAAFPQRLVLWGGGPADVSGDRIRIHLRSFLDNFFDDSELDVAGCTPAQASWDIPFPVVALEAALLFSFLRLSHLWLKTDGWVTALASAAASGFLMTNLTAVLDPVVSTSQVCGTAAVTSIGAPLSLGIWHWYTNGVHPGLWFGVPLINYLAWFLTAAIFSFVVRLEDEGPRGLFRGYKRWFGYLWPGFVLLLVFVALMPAKVLADKLLLHGQEYLFGAERFSQTVWQFGFVGFLNAIAVLTLVWCGRFRQRPQFEWFAAAAQLVVFVYCLGALLNEPNPIVFLVWAVTGGIALLAIFWPRFRPERERVFTVRGRGIPNA
jgi:hypothetical protein